MSTNQLESDQAFSGVAQTANIGSSTSMGSGAAKIFREFKWGLLTLFILMTVVVCLVYDGGRGKKKTDTAQVKGSAGLDADLAGRDPLASPDNSGANGAASQLADHSNNMNNNGGTASTATDPWNIDPNPNTPTTHPMNTSMAGNTGLNPAPTPGAVANTGGTSGTRRHSGAAIPDIGNGDGLEGHATAENPQHILRNPHGNEAHETPSHLNDPASNGGCKIYVVKPGDNLTKIAAANLPGKGGLKAIQDANKDVLTDANRLREGMKLKIPNAATSAQTADATPHGGNNHPDAAHPQNAPTEHHGSGNTQTLITQDDYVVQSGDSLERIARRVLNDSRKWKDLLEWNKDRLTEPSKLKVGMVLHMRANNSAQTAAPAGAESSRIRQHTVRAGAELNDQNANEQPNAEEVPIPLHPIAANTTSGRNEKAEAPKSGSAVRSKVGEIEDDTAIHTNPF